MAGKRITMWSVTARHARIAWVVWTVVCLAWVVWPWWDETGTFGLIVRYSMIATLAIAWTLILWPIGPRRVRYKAGPGITVTYIDPDH